MAQKRSRMAGFEILKTKKIKTPKINVTTEVGHLESVSLRRLNKMYGQHKSIMVCETKKGYKVIDGAKYFKTLVDDGFKKVLCFNVGKLRSGEFEILRVLCNAHQSRLDFLGIAELIKTLRDEDLKETTISDSTGIDLKSVERYAKLLDFDWDEFNRKQINQQFNPFENYGEEE